ANQSASHGSLLAVRTQQRQVHNLPNEEFGNKYQLCSHRLAGLIGPEHFFGSQGTGGNSLRQNVIHAAGFPFDGSPANMEGATLHQANEGKFKSEEVSSSHYDGLHELIQLADGTQL